MAGKERVTLQHRQTLVPRAWLEPRLDIVSWSEMPRGGHFAALEQPALLLEDIRQFFSNPAVLMRL
jgi:pimeloyl-ACP methyl ester carboxylesterase